MEENSAVSLCFKAILTIFPRRERCVMNKAIIGIFEAMCEM